jgi:DNA-binding CsgD family transcriptional regulator
MLLLSTGKLHTALAAPADGSLAALTRREREVLEWVAAGKKNRDIAQILGARPRTIEKHLERVYEKLGVEGRTAAAMRLVRL